jgi:GT2 family glycosyltransferase
MQLVSIIIVNYNGKKWLKKCLDSLFIQTHQDFEIILVDNNSSDDSVKFLKSQYSDKRLHIIEHTENSGFAGGNNIGIEKAKGEFLYLLNNDTWVEKDIIETTIKLFDESNKIATIQTKIQLMNEKDQIDSAGSFWSNSTLLYHYGANKESNLEKYNQKYKVFTTKAASVFIRKSVLDEIGAFDDDFWAYYEETDLNHRMWIAGYECWYYPGSTCYHANGGTSLTFSNDIIQFHNFKNKIMSFIKNFSGFYLFYVLFTHLIIMIGLSLFWLLKGKNKHFLVLYKAIWWNVLHINQNIKKRLEIQSNRQVSDKEINKNLLREPSLDYYIKLLNGNLGDYKDSN